MKKIKISSLFKITFLLLINIFIDNNLLLILSIIILLIDDYKNLIIFIILFLFINVLNNKTDFIKYGVVKEINTNDCIVEKLLYEVKINDVDNLDVGDIIKFEINGTKNETEYELKRNVLYVCSKGYAKCFNVITRSYSNKRINSFDDNTANYLKKFLLNEYVDDLDINLLGYGFCFYYLLSILLKKNKYICLIIIVLCILFFGFQIKLYLIIFDFILSFFNLNKYHSTLIKLIL